MTTEIERKFFKAMGINPVMLCQCSFKNLKDYRLEIGDDNCEHLDDYDFSCNDCEKSSQNIPLYPIITSDIILELITILIDNGQTLKMFEASKMFKDHTRYIINADNEVRHDIYGTGATFNEAVLSLCMRFDNLKPQVQALFGGKNG